MSTCTHDRGSALDPAKSTKGWCESCLRAEMGEWRVAHELLTRDWDELVVRWPVVDDTIPTMSSRRLDMSLAAGRYYEALDRFPCASASPEELDAIRTRLDVLSEPYADDVAYTSWLRYRRHISENRK